MSEYAVDIHKLPRNKAVLYSTDGSVTLVDIPSDTRCLRHHLNCTMLQMVPCTMGALTDKAELWMDEEGFESPLNDTATNLFKDQVFGGWLHGNVMLVHKNSIE